VAVPADEFVEALKGIRDGRLQTKRIPRLFLPVCRKTLSMMSLTTCRKNDTCLRLSRNEDSHWCTPRCLPCNIIAARIERVVGELAQRLSLDHDADVHVWSEPSVTPEPANWKGVHVRTYPTSKRAAYASLRMFTDLKTICARR